MAVLRDPNRHPSCFRLKKRPYCNSSPLTGPRFIPKFIPLHRDRHLIQLVVILLHQCQTHLTKLYFEYICLGSRCLFLEESVTQGGEFKFVLPLGHGQTHDRGSPVSKWCPLRALDKELRSRFSYGSPMHLR